MNEAEKIEIAAALNAQDFAIRVLLDLLFVHLAQHHGGTPSKVVPFLLEDFSYEFSKGMDLRVLPDAEKRVESYFSGAMKSAEAEPPTWCTHLEVPKHPGLN